MLCKTAIFIFILFISTNAQRGSGSQSHERQILKEIIFWGPSAAESDSLNEEETEAFSDYYYYIGQASQALKTMGIELKDTTSFELRISYREGSTEVFQRERGAVAYIFNDGKQKPKIIRNVMLSEEIISAAKEFFGIKDQ